MLAQAPILLQSAPVWIETKILKIRQVTPTIKALRFEVPWSSNFRAGQCVDFRLTAEDGYAAQRYYSIATSPASGDFIEVLVERQDGGEVSSFLHDQLLIGDTLEVRGPIGGGPFTWEPSDPGPILLIGGGSGVVPLLSMARHRRDVKCRTPFTLVYSVKRQHDILACDELVAMAETDPAFQLVVTLTREAEGTPRFLTGRLNRDMLSGALKGIWAEPTRCFICGSNAFVGDISDILLERGLAMHQVRTERFGG
jgi:ferredoxin-NADP reductase